MNISEERRKDFHDKLHHGLRPARQPWYDAIQQHIAAIGTVSGFTIAILGAFSAFIGTNITPVEFVILVAASIVLFIQVYFWLNQIKRSCEAEWNIYNAITDKELYDGEYVKKFIAEARRLRDLNTQQGNTLNKLVLWSLGLMMFLIVYHALVSVYPDWLYWIDNLMRVKVANYG